MCRDPRHKTLSAQIGDSHRCSSFHLPLSRFHCCLTQHGVVSLPGRGNRSYCFSSKDVQGRVVVEAVRHTCTVGIDERASTRRSIISASLMTHIGDATYLVLTFYCGMRRKYLGVTAQVRGFVTLKITLGEQAQPHLLPLALALICPFQKPCHRGATLVYLQHLLSPGT
jgi:hypothetical protein